MKNRQFAACAVLLLSFASVAVQGQVLNGSLVGTVTDESGAVVPGASITIEQAETNQSRAATTNAAGAYSFQTVAVGTYHVIVTSPGFRTLTARAVTVQQNTVVRVDAKLTIGAVQESVEVSSAGELLQTDSASVQTQTTKQQLESLPTSGRSFQSLLALTPGVQQPNYFQSGGINNPSRSMVVTINGQPASNTVFRIDGVSATNQWIQSLQSYSPAIEAIETISAVTNSFDADLGMAGGASINVQVKSGTNALHGSGFEYFEDARLRARNFFLPPTSSQPVQRQNVFGGTLGGPILKNKLFFFVSDETTFNDSVGGGAGAQTTASTAGFQSLAPGPLRAGDFSTTGTVIYDPLTGNASGQGRTPFAGAAIPGNRINAISKNVLAKLIAPTLPGFNNNYFASSSYSTTYHKIDTKLNWNINSKLSANMRLSFLPNTEHVSGLLPSVDGGEFNGLSLGRQWDSSVKSAAWAMTAVLSHNFVVDGVFGFTNQHTTVVPDGPLKCWGDDFGIANSCQKPYSRDYATPQLNITGWSALGNSAMRDYLDPQYQIVANAGWVRAAHNIKFGVDIHRTKMNHYETTVPTFNFTGGSTALSGGASPNNFNAFADFLLGAVSSRSATAMTPLLSTDGANPDFPATLRSLEAGVYVRDQWQITRKMTVSLGLRWEYYPLPIHADRGLEIFDFNTYKFKVCGLGGNPTNCGITVEKDLFSPRLGWAYRPTDTLVIRAGFSRNPQNDNSGRGSVLVFPSLITITQSAANSFSSVGSFSEGAPVVPQVDLKSGSVNLPAGASVATLPQQYVRGRITSYNVTIQKLFPHSLTAQIGYVGNRQTDMIRNQNRNYGLINGGQASQPYFKLAGITGSVSVAVPQGHVEYNSLQASFSRRMKNGFAFTSAYTWSKSIDWWAGSIPIPEYWGLNKAVAGVGGLGDQGDTPHKFDLSATYELPFGRGKALLDKGGVLSAIVGGWSVNGYFTAFTGQAYTVTSSATSLNAPGSPQRADQVKDKVEVYGQIGPNSAYFDVTAFRPVTAARFGTAGFNTLRAPSIFNLDASVFRTFKITERFSAQFRAEAFNATNTPHFSGPSGTNVSNLQLNADGTVRNLNGFGVISTSNPLGREYDERYFRLGVRISF